MAKLSLLVFVIVAPTVAGILVVIALAAPNLGFDGLSTLWMVVVVGAVVSIPLSLWIGSALNNTLGNNAA